MPNKEWFEDNKKISAYVHPDLRNDLHKWMRQRRVRSESEAIKQILEEFFGVEAAPLETTSYEKRLVAVESAVLDLSVLIQKLSAFAAGSAVQSVEIEDRIEQLRFNLVSGKVSL